MRLATFNLENLGEEGPDAPSREDRIATLRPQLERTEADILCLQEVNAHGSGDKAPRTLDALDDLLEGTAYAGFHRQVSRRTRGPLDRHNLVTLSRWPFKSARQLWHELVPAPTHGWLTARGVAGEPTELEWERPTLWAEVALPGGRLLHVFNLHLRAPLAAFVPGQKAGAFKWRTVAGWAEGFYMAAVKRAGQALEARLAVDQAFDRDPRALIAVAGDCNAEARETALRLLCGDEVDTGNNALAGRALVPVERSVTEDLRYTVIHAGRRTMLDHLLVSHPLMGFFRRCEIHNEALGDELVAYANRSPSAESYHAPVVAEFALPEE